MISNLNPYPKQPGFGRRVAYAKRALKQLARKPWSRLPVSSRAFDNCFENGDGTAVVWTLMQAARTDPELEQGIIWLDGGRGHLLKEWQRIYGFPMSVRPAFQQAAQPPVDLVSPVPVERERNHAMQTLSNLYNLPLMASGEKTQARAILAAIRALTEIERAQRPATADERETLMRFAGFGKMALSLFPNPVTGRYKDESWQALGEELRTLLSPEEYDSAKRTTFTAFYTSPVVIGAMHDALAHLGVPEHATVLEPGCGSGRFMSQAPDAMRFIGVELDSLSGRIARALQPGQDIRIENFRDTRLPEDRIDAVIGNVPFADIRLGYGGQPPDPNKSVNSYVKHMKLKYDVTSIPSM